MAAVNGNRLPAEVLEAVRELAGPEGKECIMYDAAAERIKEARKGDRPILPEKERFALQKAILDYWNDLLRSGVIAFGADGSNWDADVFHLTATGRGTLSEISRDPINPDGYMNHLRECAAINAVSESYIREALHTYRAGCHKATAVMVGTAAEGMILSLRDVLLSKLKAAKPKPEKGLGDWRIKVVCDALAVELEKWQGQLPQELLDRYNIYWAGFTAHIRAIRNASGHPNNIDPVTPETVHAALLIFPEFARLAADLEKWAAGHTF